MVKPIRHILNRPRVVTIPDDAKILFLAVVVERHPCAEDQINGSFPADALNIDSHFQIVRRGIGTKALHVDFHRPLSLFENLGENPGDAIEGVKITQTSPELIDHHDREFARGGSRDRGRGGLGPTDGSGGENDGKEQQAKGESGFHGGNLSCSSCNHFYASLHPADAKRDKFRQDGLPPPWFCSKACPDQTAAGGWTNTP